MMLYDSKFEQEADMRRCELFNYSFIVRHEIVIIINKLLILLAH